jgi:hypothetical protein
MCDGVGGGVFGLAGWVRMDWRDDEGMSVGQLDARAERLGVPLRVGSYARNLRRSNI